MNPAPLRYVLTRPCLSEGSLTLAKYLQALFPADLCGQTLQLSDEQGRSYAVQMHPSGRRLTGLGALYHDHNLNVNDVLLLSRVSETAYQVTCVVKPYSDKHAASTKTSDAQPRRVVINATPHVREIRLAREAAPADVGAARSEEAAALSRAVEEGSSSAHVTVRRGAAEGMSAVSEVAQALPAPQVQPRAASGAERRSTPAGAVPVATLPVAGPGPHLAAPLPVTPLAATSTLAPLAEQLTELAALTGYRLEFLGGHESGPVRLRADLGQHSYDVALALSDAETQHPAFKQSTYHALITWEVDAASGAPRFTREALGTLLEHARLAPLTPIDLRGYWNTASFDLNSVASLAELVSAHLAQRGTFSYVLSVLSQQSAHSVVDPGRLAERLGSGVNKAELHAILETLSQAPFMALLPLPGGQYYLRADVSTLLGELAQYAQGIARRLQAPTRAARA